MKGLYKLIIYMLFFVLFLSACVSKVQPTFESDIENQPTAKVTETATIESTPDIEATDTPIIESPDCTETSEPNISITNDPKIGFGYANIDGSRLIAQYGQVDDSRQLTGFKYAIGENGNCFEIEYCKYQEMGEKWNGRQTMLNFDNEPGCIYNVVSATAVPNNTYMLITEEEYEKIAVLHEKENTEIVAVSDEWLEKCSKLANREVKNGWLLSEYQNGYKVSMVGFINNDRDLLAWLVLENDETFYYCEFPAELSEDGFYGWAYGDCGELVEDMLFVLCTIQNQQETVVYLAWYSTESESIIEVKFSPDKTATQKSVSWRYVYPI